MDPMTAAGTRTKCRLPRVSGDGPLPLLAGAGLKMAAPRERGWTLVYAWEHCTFIGCPA